LTASYEREIIRTNHADDPAGVHNEAQIPLSFEFRRVTVSRTLVLIWKFSHAILAV
jgi:hypothetical protein